MIRYKAAWVVPISRPPIRGGWVDVDEGRIVRVGGPDAPAEGDEPDHEIVLDGAALMPGLVNAHTHLELSYLHDAVPAAGAFVSWIRGVMAERRRRPDPAAPEIVGAIDRSIEQARAAGTVLVGDVSNTLVTFERLTECNLAGVVFHEIIRFNAADADAIVAKAAARVRALGLTGMVRASLAAHAPYSVAPAVFRAIGRHVEEDGASPWTVHLAESVEEVEFVGAGTGPWRSLLEEVEAWDPSWTPAGASPVEYLDRQGLIGPRLLAVHGVQMSPADLARLAARGATLVTCPRSNRHTGAGTPPIGAFYASGVRVAVGTDSLASAPDLNVFAELAEMHALAPSVPASMLLDSATRQGARALGFGADFGVIEPGRLARLLAVSVPPGTADVERYLVSGVGPDAVRWVP